MPNRFFDGVTLLREHLIAHLFNDPSDGRRQMIIQFLIIAAIGIKFNLNGGKFDPQPQRDLRKGFFQSGKPLIGLGFGQPESRKGSVTVKAALIADKLDYLRQDGIR